jgi:hypothetical protein
MATLHEGLYMFRCSGYVITENTSAINGNGWDQTQDLFNTKIVH